MSSTINVPASSDPFTIQVPIAITAPLDPALNQYNNWAFEIIVHEHMDKLRGRLMDIAECSTRDRLQAKAMQALMKDALNQAFHDTRRNLEAFCRDKGIIAAGEGQEHPAGYGLRADSITEYLYEPPR